MANDLIQRFFGKAPALAETPHVHVGSTGFDGYTDVRFRDPVRCLTLQGAVDVYYRRAAECAVVVGGDSQATCDAIKTKWCNAELTISGAGGSGASISVDGMHINVSARGSVFINGQRFDGTTLGAGRAAVLIAQPEAPDVHLFGSGDVDLADVNQKSLALVIQGSGDVRAAGHVGTLSVDVMGSGDVDAAALAAQHASCRSMGSGDVSVRASRSITARLMGSGDLRVMGNSPARDTCVMGSGDLRFR